jgi:hypothetical protein
VPRADPAIPIPPELEALIERGASVMMGSRDSELVPELVRAWGPRVSRDRKHVSVCVAMAAGRPHRDDLTAVQQHRDTFAQVNKGIGVPLPFIEALWQRELTGSPVMVRIRIVAEQIFNQTPGPDAGSPL